MLARELKENPDDGKLHYYLGLALKKQGMDTKALRELEMAVRLCPDDMIASFAQEKLVTSISPSRRRLLPLLRLRIKIGLVISPVVSPILSAVCLVRKAKLPPTAQTAALRLLQPGPISLVQLKKPFPRGKKLSRKLLAARPITTAGRMARLK